MTQSTNEQSFESAFSELEKILRQLEDGSTSLEVSLSQYEKGISLLNDCYRQLQRAEQRIQLLTGLDAEGKPLLQPFEHASSIETPKIDEKKRITRGKPRENDSSY